MKVMKTGRLQLEDGIIPKTSSSFRFKLQVYRLKRLAVEGDAAGLTPDNASRNFHFLSLEISNHIVGDEQ